MMNFFKRSILGKILYIIRDFYRFPNGKKVFNSDLKKERYKLKQMIKSCKVFLDLFD